jgi:hypothetical protein
MNGPAIDWLLQKDNPPVRLLTLTDLLGESPRSRAAASARSKVMQYGVTRKIISHMDRLLKDADDGARTWGYDSLFWNAAFLGQFLADGRDARVARLVRYMLERDHWHPKGSCEGTTAPCYAAIALTSLATLGNGNDPVVVRRTEALAARIVAAGGIECQALAYSLLPRCHMALPKILMCLAAVPAERRTPAVKKATSLVVKRLVDREVYVYVSAHRKEWQKILQRAPKRAELPGGTTVKAWIAERRRTFFEKHDPACVEPKKGWLKFGFPLGYNSDVLEALYALCMAGVKMTRALERPLQVVRDKMRPDGTWAMENSLNGKMLVDVEAKGKPSKWLTHRALRVLKHFG